MDHNHPPPSRDRHHRLREQPQRQYSVPPGDTFDDRLEQVMNDLPHIEGFKQQLLPQLLDLASEKYGDVPGARMLKVIKTYLAAEVADAAEAAEAAHAAKEAEAAARAVGVDSASEIAIVVRTVQESIASPNPIKKEDADGAPTTKASIFNTSDPTNFLGQQEAAKRYWAPYDEDGNPISTKKCGKKQNRKRSSKATKRKHDEKHSQQLARGVLAEYGQKETINSDALLGAQHSTAVGPIIKLLYSGPAPITAPNSHIIISVILQRLKDLRDAYSAIKTSSQPALIWSTRNVQRQRLSYNLDSPDGMAERLAKCFVLPHRESSTDRLENCLTGLVCWNHSLFPELVQGDIGKQKYPSRNSGIHKSTIDILVERDSLVDFRPVMYDNKDEICESVFKCLARRFLRNCPDTLRLQRPMHGPEHVHGLRRKRLNTGEDRAVAVAEVPFAQVLWVEKYHLSELEEGSAQVNFSTVLKMLFRSGKTKSSTLESEIEREIYTLAESERSSFPELFEVRATAESVKAV